MKRVILSSVLRVSLALAVGAVLVPGGASSAAADSYAWANFAGQPGGTGNVDGTGSAARFHNPEGIAADSAGNLYVADKLNHTIRKVTPAGVVTTLAGLAGSPGSVDGTGSGARFNGPCGVALDSSGNLYVAEYVNHTIRKVTSAGVVTTLAGLAGTSGTSDGTGTAARFNTPIGVSVDGSGNIYVADNQNHAIRKVTSGGVVSTFAGLAGTSGSLNGTGTAARFNTPVGIAIDSSGNLYVGDSHNHTIRKITSSQVVTTLAGLAGSSGSADGTGSAARFSFPSGVAADSAGNVYVADNNNCTIRRVTSGGVVTTPAGLAGTSGSSDGAGSAARFYYPYGIGIDNTGYLYVADESNHTIRKMTAAGAVSTLAGQAGSPGSADGTGNAARFGAAGGGPSGVTVDSAGTIYVADTFNYTIRKITAAGVVTTLAGSAGLSGSTDGTGNAARFYRPYGLAADSSGNLYVADSQNSTIRMVTSAGVVSTFAGTAGSTGTTDGTGTAARFNQPWAVAVDSSGNVYVADTYNCTIRKISPSQVVTTLAGLAGSSGNTDGAGSAARFHLPSGVAADSAGNVYVADYSNHTIREVTPSGVVTTLAGSAGSSGSTDGTGSSARFNHPFGVAADSSGNLYVGDQDNQAIRKITPAGLVTTIGGTAGAIGGMDGVGSAAQFAAPKGVAVSSAGVVYVADANNNRVGKGTPPPMITTASPLPDGGAGAAYSQSLTASGGTSPYTWSISSGNLPAGLTLSSDGLISGAPTATTTASFTVQVAGNDGAMSFKDFNLTIVLIPPTITTASPLPAGTVGVTYSQSLAAASGTTPYTWSLASGILPAGLSLNSNGLISGIPTAVGTAGFTVQVTGNNGASSTRDFSLTIVESWYWTNLAGQPGGLGNADGTGSVARFYNPYGVAVDGAGNIYVADSNNHTIRKVSSSGVVTTLAGLAGSSGSTDGAGSTARFNNPSGVAVDSVGNLYVTDKNNQIIRKVTSAGVVSTLAGQVGVSGTSDGTGTAARFNGPAGVAVDGAGNLYVADSGNHAIRKVTSAGVVTTFAGLAGASGSSDGTGTAARFNSPIGAAIDSSGNLYVGDSNNHTIRRVISGGVVTTLAGLAGTSGSADGTGSAARFYQPAGVGTDSAGNIYVADYYNHTIRKVTSGGVVGTLAGSAVTSGSTDGTGSAARFYGPAGVAADGAGNVYVADYYNHTIRKVTSGGVVTTLAGSAGTSGTSDGTGSAARFEYPTGVAADGAGNVYVADRNNHTIRKVTSAGVVTTLAGQALASGSTDGTGSAARFYWPAGVAADSAGNVYVADSNNCTIRKVTSAGVVTTLAGSAGASGSADGTGSAARFCYPTGVAADSAGNVYVADRNNCTIRKVTPAGAVTTLAGLAGSAGSTDGTGSAARFDFPCGVAVDSAGNVYVADYNSNTIRKVTSVGVVTTLAGLAGSAGSTDGTGSAARFYCPSGLAADSAGNVYVADQYNHTIRKITPARVVTTIGGAAGIAGGADGMGGSAIFSYPFGIAAGTAGKLYVADSNNSRISKGSPASPPTITTTSSLPAATVGVAYSKTLAATGGTAPYTWSIASGAPPAGLTLSSAGLISGTPTAGTTANFTVQVTGNDGLSSTADFTLTVLAPPTITSSALPAGTIGYAYTFTLTATGGFTPYSWSISTGSLPSGLSLSSGGTISGTPGAPGTSSFTIRVTGADGASSTSGFDLTIDEPYSWTNFAGQPGGIGTVDGTGSAARFYSPFGAAADSAGNIYVADYVNHTIRKVTPSGVVTTLAGLAYNQGSTNGTGSAARFYYPWGVAVDGTGNVYVAEEGNHTIRKVTPSGVVTTLAGLAGSSGSTNGTGSAARFNYPHGVAVDGAGNLYVADSENHTIRKVTPVGAVTTLAGLAGSSGSTDGTGNAARFNYPSGVSVDSAGNVYVADELNNTIRKVTSAGVVTTLAGLAGSAGSTDGTGSIARFHLPEGVAVDGAGNVYVADMYNHTIRMVTPLGVVTTLAGLAGSSGNVDGTGSAARFNKPYGMAADGAGNVYVADTVNCTIRKVTPSGAVTTLAGLASFAGSTDGTGSAARFYDAQGVAADSAGNLHVADYGNNTIRKVTPSGVVTTLAGLPGSGGSADGTGSAARFWGPTSVAPDAAGNVYVVDTHNHTIRKVTSAGVVTTLAGLAGSSGSTDGTGSAARFYLPYGVATDSAGNVYVADTFNHTIRKVMPSGVVTTLAGLAGSYGSTDGTGSAARFIDPSGVATDSAGNVYVADTNNGTIRKVTPTGVVTTLAGLAGLGGCTDGVGSAARFNFPFGVAVDSSGNVFVGDQRNHTIRKVTPTGVVTTIGGSPGMASGVDGIGASARFSWPAGIAVDGAGNLYVADGGNNRISKGRDTRPPMITTTSPLPGGTVGVAYSQNLAATGGMTPYTWSISSGSLPAGLTVNSAGLISGTPTAATTASFTVQVTGSDGMSSTGDFTLTVAGPPTITSSILPAGTVGVAYTYTLTATGGTTPYSWSISSGNLPSGLSLSSGGTISGTPGAPGTAIFTIRVTGGDGASSTSDFTLTIVDAWYWSNFVGHTGGYGNVDGTGSAARFNGPEGVAVDSGGNVYVTEFYSHTIRKVTPAGVVTTIAGLSGSIGSSDGTGSAARFDYPEGIAADSVGNVYVADSDNDTIRKVTPAGAVTTLAGLATFVGSNDGSGSAARFNKPIGVAVDGAGNVYVTDFGSHTIRKVTPGGVVSTIAGLAGSSGSADGTGNSARFHNPAGIAVDASGDLYVTDNGNNTIRKVTPAGVVSTIAGLAGSGGSADGTGSAARFSSPWGIALDSAGNLLVSDFGNATIRRVTTGGTVTTVAGSAGLQGSADGVGSNATFWCPRGVGVDSAGNGYVADEAGQTIRKIAPDGAVTTLAGLAEVEGSTDGPTSVARFCYPSGLDVDNAGSIYVSDSSNHTIRKVTTAGIVTTIAGSAGVEGSADGTGSAARFQYPKDLAVDSAGSIYVADEGNFTIRKITAASVVTTLAGQAGFYGSSDGIGSAARFGSFKSGGATGVATDGAGNVYVADTNNYTIRKIAPAGSVTTLAGQAGYCGIDDGMGSAARFNLPNGVAADVAGNVYVADTSNCTLRKVTPAGLVSTLAGLAGSHGSTDGAGGAARFNLPNGVAADAAGNLYVIDNGNNLIRKVTPAGVVTTIGGALGAVGANDGIGGSACFSNLSGIAIDSVGTLYVTDNNRISVGTPVYGPPPLPCCPNPSSGQTDLAISSTLTWRWNAPGRSFDLYFGTSNPPTTRVASGLSATSFTPSLSLATRYYWKVVAINSGGQTEGPVWTFATHLTADINGDGNVNVSDLQQLVTAWASHGGSPPSINWDINADLNTDSYVNVGDLQVLIANWGRSVN